MGWLLRIFISLKLLILFIVIFYNSPAVGRTPLLGPSANDISFETVNSIRQLILEHFYPPPASSLSWETTAHTLEEKVRKGELNAVNLGRVLVESLEDPYSMLLSPIEAASLTGQLAGKDIIGIGITILPRDGGFLIGGILRHSPAWAVGIMSGDEIIAIDGESLAGKSMSWVLRKLSGDLGSSIILNIKRGGKISKNIFLARTRLQSSPVEIDRYGDIGIIKLSVFGYGVADEIRKQLSKFQLEGVRYCILDLRNNPGGLFKEAMDTAGLFLPFKSIICHKDSRRESVTYLSRTKQYWSGPLIVLVNGGTASGSELVAAALKDHKRGVIYGTITAGKGSVQKLIPIDNGWYLNLTTANYRSPAGNIIHRVGVTPAIIIEESVAPLGLYRKEVPFVEVSGIKISDEVLGRSLKLMRTIPFLK